MKNKTKSKKTKNKERLVKCKICGDVIDIKQWMKHLYTKHNIGEIFIYENYFYDNSKKKCRCKRCDQIIPKKDWRSHLSHVHNMGAKFRAYFESPDTPVRKDYNEWYEHNRQPIHKDWHCGDVLSGPPRVTITYNALCTNRRKH